jgi:hypothetical protein
MAEKPSLKTENVFLDTCVFVAENYSSTAYQTLIRLGTISAVKLKITDITLREIERQIKEKLDEATKSLNAKGGKSGVLRNFDAYNELMEKFAAHNVDALASELWRRVNEQLTEANVEIINASGIPAGPVFDAYFAQLPPFAPGQKSKEFPDAFAIAALKGWCDENGEDLHVITTDATFKAACKAADGLYPLESLAAFVDLALREDEYVELAVEHLKENLEPIRRAVKTAIEDQYAYLTDEDGDGEITVDEMDSLDIEDVVKSDGNKMVLKCLANVSITADVTYDDPDMTYWDSEDKVAHVAGHIREQLHHNIDVDAEVTIEWNGQKEYLVEKVVIEDGHGIALTVDRFRDERYR